MSVEINPPFRVFTDVDGEPLEDGYIHIGAVNQNPQAVPISVFWDSALTIPAAQPIRTLGGYPSRTGTPSRMYVAGDAYSISVSNKNGTLIYSELDNRSGDAGLRQDLANGTDLAKGPALLGYRASDQSAYIANTIARTMQAKGQELVSVFDFLTPQQITAVRTNAVFDLTVPVQAALDYADTGRAKHLIFPAGDYCATQLTFGKSGNRNGSTYTLYGTLIRGIGSGRSIVQIKTGFNTIRGLNVTGDQSELYECGVHWFTNDVATYYPGFMNLQDMHISGCLIGLAVGALPTQATIPPATPPAVLADGQAVNAPLSESFVTNLQIKDCIRGMYMRQPNGKLSFIQPVIDVANSQWAASSATAEGNLSAVQVKQGELSIIGGELLNIESTTGQLAYAELATLNIMGTILESKTPIFIGNRGVVRICNNANWGLNNDSNTFFKVYDDADGELQVTDSFLRRGYGTASSQPILRVITGAGATSANTAFAANFTNTEFGDANMTQGASYQPLIIGCRSVFKNCWLTKHSGTDPFPRTESVRIDEGQNALVGKVDLAFSTVTAYAVQAGATVGGWTFTNAGGGCSWGRQATDLPIIQGQSVTNALRLTSVAGQEVNATSAKFPVQPQRGYLLKGWAKRGGTGNTLRINVNYFDFAGVASTIDSQLPLYSGQEVAFSLSGWAPFMFYFVPPADTCEANINVNNEAGADLRLVGLEII